MIGYELWHDPDSLPDRLLATRIPVCIAIAIAICADATSLASESVSYHTIVSKLKEQGISSADAIWLTGHFLKDAVHRHHIIASQGKRLLFDARHEQSRRTSKASSRVSSWLAEQRADHAKRKLDHELRLNNLFNDIAAAWPNDGLSEQQMKVFDIAFVDTADMRLRLALKLVHSENRESLFKRNIDYLLSELGFSGNPDVAFDEYHAPEPDRFYDIAVATARSFITLHSETPHNIGRKTSNLLAKGVKVGFEFVEQPFMWARQPIRWQSALSRTSCAIIFALVVVEMVERAHQPAVEKLRRLAIEHAANLLVLSRNFSSQRSVLDTLAWLSIHAMIDRPTEREELIVWSQRTDLPAMVRVGAQFAIAHWLPLDHERAKDLFQIAAQLPLSPRSEPEQFNRLATVVDLAVARASFAKDTARLSFIVELWSALGRDWSRHMADCEDFAQVLVQGLSEDGPERQRILDDDMFAGTFVRYAINNTGQHP